ncbi:hypothetical protein WJX73_008884 [Symbiochloris irregularis]|uniref:Nodulin-like domain-containing protein n=1 Tax=Symbiochloris irregularis TaxID=706552 RepID=A0AAW1PB14_9CHLO
MLINKWFTLSAAALLQLVSGFVYTFSLFAPAVKLSSNYDQVQLQGIGTAILSGGYLAWAPGLTYDALLQKHHKLAPRLVAGMGSAMISVGLLGIWSQASHSVDLPYWGKVAGILKSYLGLSASICTSVYIAVFKPNELDFLIFLAVAALALGAIAVPFLNYAPEHSSAIDAGSRLNVVSFILVAVILYQAVSVFTSVEFHASRTSSLLQVCGVLALLAAATAIIPQGTGGLFSRPSPAAARMADADALVPHDDDEAERSMPRSEQANKGHPEAGDCATSANLRQRSQHFPDAEQRHLIPSPPGQQPEAGSEDAQGEEQPTLPQCLLTLDYWLLSSSFVTIMGAGFTLLNNLGQMVQSRGASHPEAHVLAFTTCNCLGRLACGTASEHFLHRYGTARTLFPMILAIGTSVVDFSVAFGPTTTLLPLAAAGGLFFGAQWPLMPTLTAEVFGNRHFCANQSVPQAATAVGALLFANQLAGRIYQAHVPAHETTCRGDACFRLTFIILGALTAGQALVSWVFWKRTRHRYR